MPTPPQKSLAISGTMDGRFDIDGVQRSDHANSAAFTLLRPFPQPMRETHTGDPASTQPTDDAVLGNTGEKDLSLPSPAQSLSHGGRAQGQNTISDALGGDMADILRNQNLSLALALSGDAAGELSQQASNILRVEDEQIDGQSFPAITILYPQFDMKLGIDPHTHLLRRADGRPVQKRQAAGRTEREIGPADDELHECLRHRGSIPRHSHGRRPPARSCSPAPTVPEPTPAPTSRANPPLRFPCQGLDGQQVSLKSLGGSVVVLDFWATWCGPCVASLPTFGSHLIRT